MQLDLEECIAEARKRAGLETVEANAEEWMPWIRRYAVSIAKSNGEVTSDDLRHVADQFGRQPHHPNAWGAVFRGDAWECIGFRKSKYRTNNARRISVWSLRK